MGAARSSKTVQREDQLLDVKEAAVILGLTEAGLRSRIFKGTLGIEPVRIISKIRRGERRNNGVMLRFKRGDIERLATNVS